MKPYTYYTLEKSHIRLLRLSLTKKGNVKATVEYVHIHTAATVEYNVLSYSWGDSDNTTNLVCDGKWISITTSLAAALFEYVKLFPNELLWTDSISIDQEDVVEKSEQVKMMNLIIEKAKLVIGWLGPAQDSTPLAIDMIMRISKIATDHTQKRIQSKEEQDQEPIKRPKRVDTEMYEIVTDFQMQSLSKETWSKWSKNEDNLNDLKTYEHMSIEESERLGVPFSDVESWQAFIDYYDHEWFFDMWTPQHVIPSSNTIILCGSHSISWEMVKRAATWYCNKAGEVKAQVSYKLEVSGAYLADWLDLDWSMRTGPDFYPELFGLRTIIQNYPFCFERLLVNFSRRKARDDKDRIYALVGISDLELGAREGPALVDIDYSKSLEEVYADATRAVICHGSIIYEGELDNLMNARWRSEASRSWPSWVPDLRLETEEGCGYDVGTALPCLKQYKKMRSYQYVDSDDPFSLMVQGVVVGKATYVSPFNHGLGMFKDNNLQKTFDIVLSMISSYPTGETVSLAYAMTLMAGKLPDAISNSGTTPEIYAESFIGWADTYFTTDESIKQGEEYQEALEMYNDLGFDETWELVFSQRYCGRKFFVTDTGYMGLGNQYMTEGDEIALVTGLSLPCVLRQIPDEGVEGRLYVGEAYCHGVSTIEPLEGFQSAEDGLPVTQEILLR